MRIAFINIASSAHKSMGDFTLNKFIKWRLKNMRGNPEQKRRPFGRLSEFKTGISF